MQIGEITTTNSKGQIVIPKKIRSALGITTGTAIKVISRGKGLYLLPIKGFLTTEEQENSYIKILEKTIGSWGKFQSVESPKKELEIKASQNRKSGW
jgi:AbrB family looped-hinge helix DNA binding protein